jgi:hypothetical protein
VGAEQPNQTGGRESYMETNRLPGCERNTEEGKGSHSGGHSLHWGRKVLQQLRNAVIEVL